MSYESIFYKVAFYQFTFMILLITLVSYFLPSWFDVRTFILGFVISVLISDFIRKKLRSREEQAR